MRTTFAKYRQTWIDLPAQYAFIGVDLQQDFGLPTGSLYVKGGEKLGEIANEMSEKFDEGFVFWTKDWHPEKHCSFKVNGGIWPVHCEQGTPGSELLQTISIFDEDVIILKGTDVDVDSYSAFFDNDKKHHTELDEILKKKGVKKLLVMGIATDYCVKFTVLDALALGYEVALYLPGCVGVDHTPGDVDKAIKEMEDAGAVIIEK